MANNKLKSKVQAGLSTLSRQVWDSVPGKTARKEGEVGERRQEKRPLAEDSPLCSDKGRRGSDWKCCGFACFLRDMLVGTSADQE